ncbi:MAG TPA: zinc ribbon domain-containing protein [Pyrinomonadaceae bacterium]|nr:zinc ribbon domain-containing protein [Pyrinomonadaceae bacterium]
MVCSNCGNQGDERERFCRKCGTDLETALPALTRQRRHQPRVDANLIVAHSKDPDELTGNGIGSVIMGDGFLMVAVILGATNTAISSLLWLLLLIPAFFFFGKGFADVLHARQIRRRLKAHEAVPAMADPTSPQASIADVFKQHTSGDLAATPSVTERTTRELK